MRIAFCSKEIDFAIPEGAKEPSQSMHLLSHKVRVATPLDEQALKEFHLSAFSEGDEAAQVYSSLISKEARTYVLDLGDSSTFIASALTVAEDGDGYKYLLFGGTIPALRGRGLFTDLLYLVWQKEEEEHGEFNAVFIPQTEKQYYFMKKRGFTFSSFAFECSLKGEVDKYPRFSRSWQADYGYVLCKEYFHKNRGFSAELTKALYTYYRTKGGDFGMTGDGFIAFAPILREDTASDEKGKLVIDECAISPKELKKLSVSFEKCLYPLWWEQELKKSNVKFDRVISSMTTFNPEDKFLRCVVSQ